MIEATELYRIYGRWRNNIPKRESGPLLPEEAPPLSFCQKAVRRASGLIAYPVLAVALIVEGVALFLVGLIARLFCSCASEETKQDCWNIVKGGVSCFSHGFLTVGDLLKTPFLDQVGHWKALRRIEYCLGLSRYRAALNVL